MRLVVKNSLGYSEELFVKSQTVRISTLFNYLEVTLNDETLHEVTINDQLYPCQKNQDGCYIIPCYMSRENHTVITFVINRKPIRLVIKYTDELFVGDSLIDSFGDFHRNITEWLNGEKKSVHQLVEAIKGGDIHLLQIINPLTGLDDESLLEDIYKVLPFALDICTKPRQHLRMEEEVMDVELVKRITPSSLQHLASHSEHWRSRTVTGLIPSRLKAEIYEDDLNIYENIFFKMVIEAILNYVVKKHDQIKKAISQKDTLHDWEFYAGEINDYHKLTMLQSLLPEYDSETEEKIRAQFRNLEEKIITIEKQLSSVISTPFFQSIDPTRRLELPIQPTNIINMDNRYNELFKVWNKIMALQHKPQEEITGASIVDIHEYYRVYVQVLCIYSLHLLGYTFHEDSFVESVSDHKIHFSYLFSHDFYIMHVENHSQELEDLVTLRMEESLSYEVPLPESFPASFKELEEDFIFKEIMRDNQRILVFRKKPDSSLEKKLGQVIKKYIDDHKHLTTNQKMSLKKLDTIWRKQLSEEVAKIPLNRVSELNLHMLFTLIGKTENDLQKYTDYILNSAESSPHSTDIFMLPITIEDFAKVENLGLLQRLINFGEAYAENDAPKFGNYRRGILPISQTDLRSIQRLSKLFHLFIYKQLFSWGTNFLECPGCQSKNILKMDEHSWQCREMDCQLVWGVTRCSTGCLEFYEWMKPSLKLKLSKKPNPQSEGYLLDQILLNEMLFDRSVITAFDYKLDRENGLIYHPRCPKCGKSSFH